MSLRNSGSISPDNTASSNFVSAYGSALGPHVVPGAKGQGPYCAQAIEYDGIVNPTNYQGAIALTRLATYHVFVDSTGVTNASNQVDDSFPGLTVTLPNNGKVFDLDAPGVYPYSVTGESYRVTRTRQNFLETASLDSSGGAVLAQFQLFARTSCTRPGSSPKFSYSVPNDNTSGLGTTPLTWNLQ